MQNKFLLTVIAFIIFYNGVNAQSENIIIITTDGLRWQEVFGGMDAAIANDKRFNEGDSAYLYKKYWAASSIERRKKLMPFFWTTIVKQGNLFGNRSIGNKVDVANPYWFSYPGYNEIFTGYADTAVNSNNYPPNPNVNLLEYLNSVPKYKGRIAAFGAWDAFERILNKQRSGLTIVNGFDTLAGNITEKQKLINQMLLASYKPWHEDECLDVFTHFAALEYLKTKQPKILYIAYGETDEWAHAGKYRSYVDAANQVDKWIAELWHYIQSNPAYKNKTSIFITTDHGRGDAVKEQWRDHGSNVAGASQTWFAVMGPNIKANGEVRSEGQFYTKQFVQTMASLLNQTFKANHPIGEKIELK